MQHKFNLLLLLISCVKFGLAYDYYWRDYNSLIPFDAIKVTEDLCVGQVYANSSLIPGSLYLKENKFIYEYIGRRESQKNIKILCSSHPNDIKWIELNLAEIENPRFRISQIEKSSNCVLIPGGYEHERYRWYIGKIYHENMWKISKVDLDDFKAMSVWGNNGGYERIKKFELLYACKINEGKLA